MPPSAFVLPEKAEGLAVFIMTVHPDRIQKR